MNVTLVLSSVRENRLANSVLKKVKELIGDELKYTLVDPMEYDLPLLNKRYFEMKDPEEKFRRLHDIFTATDGFIFVTAEYNHGMPAALKNMLDHFGGEFKYKVSGIISYSDGAIGGARSCEHLRLVCATLGMPSIPMAPSWGLAHKADKSEGEAFVKNFERQFKVFLPQFIWYTEALMEKRAKGTPG